MFENIYQLKPIFVITIPSTNKTANLFTGQYFTGLTMLDYLVKNHLLNWNNHVK